MKHVRIQLEDDLHHRVRVVAVASKLTLQEALAKGARLFAESWDVPGTSREPIPMSPEGYDFPRPWRTSLWLGRHIVSDRDGSVVAFGPRTEDSEVPPDWMNHVVHAANSGKDGSDA